MMDLKDRAIAFKEALFLKHPHITFKLSDYKSKLDFLDFTCSRHGEFNSSPKNILRNRYGCEKCYKELVQLSPKDVITPRKTTEEFIAEATLLHKGWYTYENTVYVTRRKPVIVTCPLHGDFVIPMASMHLCQLRGCLECKRECSMLTKEQFVEKCRERTKSFYDYTDTVYDGLANEINVTCLRHGVFTLTARSHIAGKGCQECKALGMDLYKGSRNND